MSTKMIIVLSFNFIFLFIQHNTSIFPSPFPKQIFWLNTRSEGNGKKERKKKISIIKQIIIKKPIITGHHFLPEGVSPEDRKRQSPFYHHGLASAPSPKQC